MADDPVIPPVTKPPIPPQSNIAESGVQSAQPEVDPGEIEAVNQANEDNAQPDKEA